MPKVGVSKCFLRHATLDFPGELVKGVMTDPTTDFLHNGSL